MKETKNVETTKDQFKNYLKEHHKNPSTSSEYVRWMDEIQDWFTSNGICESNFNIWLDTDSISSINLKLSNEKKKIWKQLNKEKSNWYSAPWNKWVAFNKLRHKKNSDSSNVKEIITVIAKYIKDQGFHFTYKEIANFYLSLKTKPFVILAGISGTGKSQLPKLFARSLGLNTGNGYVSLVPVRPDWTDGSDLLGYTGLDGSFIPKGLTLSILKAKAEPQKPHFFILDEMNLARVEHYFSDFLSVIETREWSEGLVGNIISNRLIREEMLLDAKNKKDYSDITWPDNLYLIGTVNMDETTHAFSRKVLDRANSIEMNEVNLDWILSSVGKSESVPDISNDLLRSKYLSSKDIPLEHREKVKEEMDFLKKVNAVLEKADLHFAYRVRDEVAFYLLLNKEHDLMSIQEAMDFQLMQKVLPRIHGSSERVQSVLVELFNLLEDQVFQTRTFEIEEIEKYLQSNNLKYPRSSKKIIFMLRRYDDDRFTSFWL